jgi:hypothetical protein
MSSTNILKNFWVSTSGLSSDSELVGWTGLSVFAVDDSTGGVFITYEESPFSPLELPPVTTPFSEKEIEDRLDAEEAKRRLADPNEVPIPYEQVRKELGLA